MKTNAERQSVINGATLSRADMINRNIGEFVDIHIVEKWLSIWKFKNQLLSIDVMFVYTIKIKV